MATYIEPVALDGLRKLDVQSVGVIYDQYFLEVYRYVHFRINDTMAAEDITSDVFVRLLEAVQKHRGPQFHLKGWLIATASNAVNDHLRRQYRWPRQVIPAPLTDEDIDISAQVDLGEQKQMFQKAYLQLTSEQQDVIALRFGQGYSLEQTATYMTKSVGAVKTLQFRALASLRRRMGEPEPDEPQLV